MGALFLKQDGQSSNSSTSSKVDWFCGRHGRGSIIFEDGTLTGRSSRGSSSSTSREADGRSSRDRQDGDGNIKMGVGLWVKEDDVIGTRGNGGRDIVIVRVFIIRYIVLGSVTIGCLGGIQSGGDDIGNACVGSRSKGNRESNVLRKVSFYEKRINRGLPEATLAKTSTVQGKILPAT